jgi:hypothetical protein
VIPMLDADDAARRLAFLRGEADRHAANLLSLSDGEARDGGADRDGGPVRAWVDEYAAGFGAYVRRLDQISAGHELVPVPTPEDLAAFAALLAEPVGVVVATDTGAPVGVLRLPIEDLLTRLDETYARIVQARRGQVAASAPVVAVPARPDRRAEDRPSGGDGRHPGADGRHPGTGRRAELGGRLRVYRERAIDLGREEDLALAEAYRRASVALRARPFDPEAAERAVLAYQHAVNQRPEEAGRHDTV